MDLDISTLRTLCNRLGFSCYTGRKDRFLTRAELIALIAPHMPRPMPMSRPMPMPRPMPRPRAGPSTGPGQERGQNPELVLELYNIFRQYPEVFPDAYFRFLKANLDESISKRTYIYEDGVLLTWKVYQKTTAMGPTTVKPGDVLLDKMVSARSGRGKGTEIIKRFLKDVVGNKTCYLKVAQSNLGAIKFYKRHGFRIIGNIDFGSVPGYVMYREPARPTN